MNAVDRSGLIAALRHPMPAPHEEEDAEERIAALRLEVVVDYQRLPSPTHLVTKGERTGSGYSFTEALFYAERPIADPWVSWKDMRLQLEAEVDRRWPRRRYPSGPQASVIFDDGDPETP